MNAPLAYGPATPRTSTYDRRALLVCGLWLRVAFIGASAALVGLLELLAGDMGAFAALAMSVAGIALAYAGERRSRAALGHVDGPAPLAAGSGAQARRPASVAGQRLAGALPKYSA